MRPNLFTSLFFIALLSISFSCSHKMVSQTDRNDIYSRKYVITIMHKVYQWQSEHPVTINASNGNDWARGAFYSGVMRAYKSTRDNDYLKGAMSYADAVNWQPGKRFRHADDMARAQAFLELYSVKKDPRRIAGIQQRVDSLIADPKPGREDWWWCDALFMEPPVLVRLSEQTGNAKYNAYLNAMWWDATDFLFDKQENLFYRDKSYFDKRTPNGKKVFWSRGNGWVMGGLVQVLEHLPKTDPYYNRYAELYTSMAAKITSLQQPDGFWRGSLLDPDEVPVKETSGTGFFTFALAWGVNNGLLDKSAYLPAVKKGWKALTEAVEPDGKLTWVQQIGGSPSAVKQSDNQEYGSGAFLMAGTEMLKLDHK